MTVLIISTRIYPDISGQAKQVYDLSKYCSENGLKIINIACLPKNYPKMKKKIINENLTIFFLPFSAPGFNAGLVKMISFFFKFLFYTIIKASLIIKKENINLVHAHSPPPSGFVAFTLKSFFNLPYFYTIHGWEVPIKLISDLDIKLVAKNSEFTFIVSRKLCEILKEGFKIDNLRWIPNAIDPSEFFHAKNQEEKKQIIKKTDLSNIIKETDFVISYIGYMVFYQKTQGMVDFLNGFDRFLKDVDDAGERKRVKLLFVGSGEYMSYVRKEVKKLDLNENVFLLGKRDDIKSLLAISDLLALTSYVEGFPIVLLEAMASKVPCIGTDTGEIRYIIDQAGYVIEPGDIIEIKRSIKDFYNLSKSEQKQLGSKTHQRIKKLFGVKRIGNKLLQIYSLYERV